MGLNYYSIDSLQGPTEIKGLPIQTTSGYFRYSSAIAKDLFLEAQIMLGDIRVYVYRKVDGFNWDKNRNNGYGYAYASAGIGLSYKKNLSKTWLCEANLMYHHASILFPHQEFLFTSGEVINKDSNFIKIEGKYKESKPLIGSVGGSMGLAYVFKNKNMLKLQVGFKQGINQGLMYQLTAFPDIAERRSTALYSNRGTELYMGLSYAFSNYNKQQSQLASDNTMALKQKNKLRNKTLELERSQLWSVGVDVGLYRNIQRVDPMDNYVSKTKMLQGLSGGIEVLKENFKYNYFVNLSFSQAYTGFYPKGDPFSYHGTDYEFYDLSFGISKPIRNKAKTIRIIEPFIGLALNYSPSGTGTGMVLFGDDIDFNQNIKDSTSYFIIGHDNETKHLWPTLVYGLKFDMRLWPRVYVNVVYKAVQGFYPMLKAKYEYNMTKHDMGKGLGYITYNGSGNRLSLGVSVYLGTGTK